MTGPSWPDTRGWATIGIFAMAFFIIGLLAARPELGDNDLFKTLATLIFGSGAFGLACNYIWGGSKASSAAADTVNHMAKTAGVHAPGSVTVEAPASVTVDTPAPVTPTASPEPPR